MNKAVTKLPKPEALSHVLYEMWMMHECFKGLHEGGHSVVSRNLHLEGFLIHARCLYEFFSDKEHRKTDLQPCHFTTAPYPKLSSKAEIYDRMNVEIAHLTHWRKSTINEKHWDTHLVMTAIAPACLPFLQSIKTDKNLLGFENNLSMWAYLEKALTPPTLFDLDPASRNMDPTTTASSAAFMTGARDTTYGTQDITDCPMEL